MLDSVTVVCHISFFFFVLVCIVDPMQQSTYLFFFQHLQDRHTLKTSLTDFSTIINNDVFNLFCNLCQGVAPRSDAVAADAGPSSSRGIRKGQATGLKPPTEQTYDHTKYNSSKEQEDSRTATEQGHDKVNEDGNAGTKDAGVMESQTQVPSTDKQGNEALPAVFSQ